MTGVRLVLLYTLLFVVGWLPVAGYLALNGSSMFWEFDGLSQQYVWFVYTGQWLREAFTGLAAGTGLPSTWDMAMGMGADVFESVLCCAANPFYALSALVPPRWAEYAFEAAMLLQLWVAGLAFLAWSLPRGTRRPYALVGAVTYVFAGSMVAVFSQPGFLFAPYAFPLLLWCADRVFAGKSPVPYVLALAWSLAYSFYDSYMMLVLLVAYCLASFFARVDAGGPGRARRLAGWVGRFVAYTFLALLVASWLLLPQVAALLGSERLGLERAIGLFYEPGYYVDFALGVTSYYFAGGDVFAGVGALIVPVFVLLLMGWRRHAWLLAAFLGLTAMLLLPAAGSLMNAFEYPTNRWCWAYSLCAAYAVARVLPELFELDGRRVAALFGALGLYGAACLVLGAPALTLLVWALVLAGCAAALLLRRAGAPQGLAVAALALCALAAGSATTLHHARSQAPFLVEAGTAWDRHVAQGPVALADAAEKAGRYDAHYRWDRASSLSFVHNSNLVSGRMGADFYNSVYNDGVDALWASLGMSDTWGINYGYGSLNGRAALDALLGVRYFYALAGQTSALPFTFAEGEILAREEVAGQEYALYETATVAPLAYLRHAAVDESTYRSLSMVDRQKALLEAVVVEDGARVGVPLLGVDELDLDARELAWTLDAASGCVVQDGLVAVEHVGATIELSYTAPASSEAYLVFEGLNFADPLTNADAAAVYRQVVGAPPAGSSLRARVNNTGSFTVRSTDWEVTGTVTQISPAGEGYSGKHDWVCNLGYTAASAPARATIVFHAPGVYTFDAFSLAAQPLGDLPVRIGELVADGAQGLELGEGTLRCSVDARDDALLFFSVAHAPGWRAWVDGEPAEVLRADLGFMAIAVPQGAHVVELAYHTPYLSLGALLSGVGLAVLALLAWRGARSRTSANAARAQA